MVSRRILSFAVTIVVIELSYHTFYERKYFSLFNGISFILMTGIKRNYEFKIDFFTSFF